MRNHQSGFSLVEVAVVIVILGLLTNLLFPHVQDARSGADAARVMNDLNTIRLAAFDYYAVHEEFPATGTLGQPPAELLPHLPSDLDFEYNGISYMWISITWNGNTIGGPLVLGPAEMIQRCDTMQANHRVLGPTYLWLMYEV